MTPEQLDEIEKRWAGYLEKNEVERRFLFDQWWDKRDFWDMTKALRKAWEALDEREGDMHARIRAGYDKTVADSWRAHCAKIEKERDETRAEVERLREVMRQVHGLVDRVQIDWDNGLNLLICKIRTLTKGMVE